MSIKENIVSIIHDLPPHVRLIAVSKTQSRETLLEAYKAGQKAFGENKVQELITKAASLPSDIQWHFIGHLQTNKVKLLVPFVHMIHSIDSMKLLSEVEKEAGKAGRVVPCLLQVHIATEETKFGLDPGEVILILESAEYKAMNHIRLAGLMGMATFTDNETLIRQEFRYLRDCFIKTKAKYFPLDNEFNILSMGMSGDFKLALDEGSNMLRIGTAIFGDRLKKSKPLI